MRTTIELPNDLRQKLFLEAMARHVKGFSVIIVEVLQKYFGSFAEKRETVVKRLKGSLSKAEYKKELRRLKEGKANWKG